VPLWFLAILVVVKTLLPDPNYGAFANQTGTTPIALQMMGVQNDSKSHVQATLTSQNSTNEDLICIK
jgi:hypothetical protein